MSTPVMTSERARPAWGDAGAPPLRLPPAVRYPLAGAATGGLLWLCHFPVAWGWLAWVALVPLLCLVRARASGRVIYLSAWLAGLLFFWPAIQWMRVADYRMYATWAGLATYCALFFPLGVYFLRRLERGTPLPLVLTLPVVWVALECCRANFGTGFGWYLLGYTQQSFLPVIQIADLGGVYAVSWLVAAVNALVFELLSTRNWFQSVCALPVGRASCCGWAWLAQAAGVLALVGGTLVYGAWRLAQDQFDVGPRLALIQGNLDQRIRNAASDKEADEAAAIMFAHYHGLTKTAAAQQPAPDLIVWPETSYPGDWIESPAGRPTAETLKIPGLLGWHYSTHILLGLNAKVETEAGRKLRYNSAVLITPRGEPAGRYDKIHRVPFGEYVPLREWLPFLKAFAPYDFDYSVQAGEQLTRFHLGKYRFGVIICFEDTDPELTRGYGRAGRDGPPADFLVNISNDGWFDGSSEHEEHLAICRFRAIECRRAVARAVNMGISALIDGNGRVVALPGPTWGESKKIAAVLPAAIPIDQRSSLYAAWGDWLPYSCGLVVALGLIWGWFGPGRGAVPVRG